MKRKGCFRSVRRAYTWNDSVLLLADVTEHSRYDYERALRDACELKCKLDADVGESYAVAVKGQRFPTPGGTDESLDGRFAFIEASSYAMANCMKIPKKFNADSVNLAWYIDERITSVIELGKSDRHKKLRLLPKNKKRWVHAYNDLKNRLDALSAGTNKQYK